MKIHNLGVVSEIELQFKNLLIFTGGNNTGKTHVSYLLYGILSSLADKQFFTFFKSKKIKEIFSDISNVNNTINIKKSEVEKEFIQSAKMIIDENIKDIAVKNFKINDKNFEKLKIEISEEEIKLLMGNIFSYTFRKFVSNGVEVLISNNDDYLNIDIRIIDHRSFEFINADSHFLSFFADTLSSNLIKIPSVFYFPAERNGINVFKNELNENRLRTYDTLMNTIQFSNLTNTNEKTKMREQLFLKNLELLTEESGNSSYPKPISDYITFLNNMKNKYEKQYSNEVSLYIRDEIIKGKYEIDEKDNSVSFRQKYGKNRYRKDTIPFHIVSSSIKSLYGLDYYIDNIGNKNDYLIIDEPELSLHPENQIKLAKVLVDLVNQGIKIIISTHSDLLIRELTNIVMENHINNDSGISDDEVGIYDFNDQYPIKEFTSISELQYFPNFDDAILYVQDRYNDLLERLDEFKRENRDHGEY